jgi:N-acetyl-gamma-glutamyl-phosphate reductase
VVKDSDVVFLCLPHKTAQDVVAEMHGKVKVIDLSADFRLDDVETYKKYYEEHKYPALLKKVVYGAPEVGYTNAIKKAETVANPGCFALLSQMLLYPFKDNIKQADIFAVTGSSGAGKSPTDGTHHPVRNHNMKSYNINQHRHIPEITRAGGITEKQLNFVPTSGPFTRGIFAQGFITLKKKADIDAAVKKAYKSAPFVRLQNEVALANIVGSNFVDLSYSEGADGKVLVQGALDNIVKGAGGSAVQNMNLMFGLKETEGLFNLAPLYP